MIFNQKFLSVGIFLLFAGSVAASLYFAERYYQHDLLVKQRLVSGFKIPLEKTEFIRCQNQELVYSDLNRQSGFIAFDPKIVCDQQAFNRATLNPFSQLYSLSLFLNLLLLGLGIYLKYFRE